MQPTKEQRTFIVEKYFQGKSFQHVIQSFQEHFHERQSPTKMTIWRDVTRYRTEGTSLNLNKGRSGRKRTGRAEENVRIVQGAFTENPQISARKSGLDVTKSTFNRIITLDFKWHPYKMHAKVEDQQLRYFLQKDKITSFDAFIFERNLQKQYENLIISRSKERLVCLFITGYFSECSLSVIVENKPTLCFPLTLSVFKNGIGVPLFKTLHPNNGLRSYTQFDETVRLAMHYDIPFDKTIQNVVTFLQSHTSACVDTEKEKKLVFLTRQLKLLLQKQFSMNDYCFPLLSYPKCNYEQLRDFLVLPCKRKLQYITSSIDKDQVLRETFDKVQTLQ
ncbi:Protein of unknown function DUF4817 [Trinorchestia longiramus]|nr:Protein of unknown function DUF4817 [Trinorchestia longiramus]